MSKTIWVASHNSDLTEGRGHRQIMAYFADQFDAERAVKGFGVMGVGDGDVHEAIVYDSLSEWMENNESWEAREIRRQRDPEGYAQYLELKKKFGA